MISFKQYLEEKRLAAIALAASLAANAHAITLNPNRIIGGKGNTAADPYKSEKKVDIKQPKIDAMTQAAPVVKDKK